MQAISVVWDMPARLVSHTGKFTKRWNIYFKQIVPDYNVSFKYFVTTYECEINTKITAVFNTWFPSGTQFEVPSTLLGMYTRLWNIDHI